jgi:hypothetical protein
MRIRSLALGICVFVLMSLTTVVLAADEAVESERWHSLYFKGDKVGMAHTECSDWVEGDDKFRKVETKGYIKVRGVAKDDRWKKVGSVAYSVGGKSKHEVLYKNGIVVEYEAKHSGSKQPTMKAEAKFENGLLVFDRKEGPLKVHKMIKPGDYDLTSDPAIMEAFLETVTTEKVTKMVFALGDAKIKKTSFVRKKDGETKDIDGVKKPASVFKTEDDEYKTTIKTIAGKIVYIKRKEKKSKNSIVSRLTTKEKAKSDSGY